MIPPTAFSDETMDPLLDDLEQALIGLGVGFDIEDFLVIVEELLYNAVQHSGKGGGTFALNAIGDRLLARVEDDGVGIHQTMARNYPDISEGEALSKAFTGGSTATGFEGRGGGLFLTLRYTNQHSGCLLTMYTGELGYIGVAGKGKLVASSGFSHQGVLAELSAPASAVAVD